MAYHPDLMFCSVAYHHVSGRIFSHCGLKVAQSRHDCDDSEGMIVISQLQGTQLVGRNEQQSPHCIGTCQLLKFQAAFFHSEQMEKLCNRNE